MVKLGCIFCGENPPVDKTLEHVIPRWLISKTGHLKRKGTFLMNGKFRELPWDNYKFPACSVCNSSYGAGLEKNMISVLKKIESEEILMEDIDILLDWMDKVRVGLFLGMQMSFKEQMLSPKYAISSRIGVADRLIGIYKLGLENKGITFLGVEPYIFPLCPSVFTLIVNDYLFVNASSSFLFSKNLGFDYPLMGSGETVDGDKHGRGVCRMKKGTGKIKLPLIRKSFLNGGNYFYQSIHENKKPIYAELSKKFLDKKESVKLDFTTLVDFEKSSLQCLELQGFCFDFENSINEIEEPLFKKLSILHKKRINNVKKKIKESS